MLDKFVVTSKADGSPSVEANCGVFVLVSCSVLVHYLSNHTIA